MARDLHDVIGHNISLINVQAGVGLDLMDTHPEQARAALAQPGSFASALARLRPAALARTSSGDPNATGSACGLGIAMHRRPAALAAAAPCGESSTATACPAAIPRRSRASR